MSALTKPAILIDKCVLQLVILTLTSGELWRNIKGRLKMFVKAIILLIESIFVISFLEKKEK